MTIGYIETVSVVVSSLILIALFFYLKDLRAIAGLFLWLGLGFILGCLLSIVSYRILGIPVNPYVHRALFMI